VKDPVLSYSMGKVMFNITSPKGAPTIESVCTDHGLNREEIDTDFGVIAVSPGEHVYTVLIDESAAARLEPGRKALSGPFSNPRIEPFGPPQ